MTTIKNILGGLFKIYIFIWFTILLLILYPFYLMFLYVEKHFNKGFMLLRFHTGLLMYLSGIFTSVKNRHYIKKGQAYVITPNAQHDDTGFIWDGFGHHQIKLAFRTQRQIFGRN